mmetsp:Transcript_900/g.2176  ORF Transcript_900/g.2176 Transcript_900/m.2176 type:complete len:89 (+) Transcript_900:374-640(+)
MLSPMTKMCAPTATATAALPQRFCDVLGSEVQQSVSMSYISALLRLHPPKNVRLPVHHSHAWENTFRLHGSNLFPFTSLWVVHFRCGK